MKLKKIVSLTAAAIMAVSMLTACEGAASSTTPPASSSEPTTTVGYSDMLYNQLSYTAKKKVTAQDDQALNDALVTAMEYAAGNTISSSYDDFIDGDTHIVNADFIASFLGNRVIPDSLENGARSLIRDMKAENVVTMTTAQTFDVLEPTDANHNRSDMNITMLFVADGLKSYRAVMDEVAEIIDEEIKLLDDDYDLYNDNKPDESMNTDYTYTISATADTITLTADHGKSMTFVAVNIHRV